MKIVKCCFAATVSAVTGTLLPLWLDLPGYHFDLPGASAFLFVALAMCFGFGYLGYRRKGSRDLITGVLLLSSGAVVCVLLSLQMGGMLFPAFCMSSFFACVLYVFPPFQFHRRAGGKFVLAVSLGMLPLLGAYIVQTGDLVRKVYVASLPLVTSLGLVMWVKELIARQRDGEEGRGSIVRLFSPRFSVMGGTLFLAAGLCVFQAGAVLYRSPGENTDYRQAEL